MQAMTQGERFIQALETLGGRRRMEEILECCSSQKVNKIVDPYAVASAYTVNDNNRFQGNRCGIRESYRTDLGHPKDRLFRRGSKTNPPLTYEIYSRDQHGVWDRVEISSGNYRPFCLIEPEFVPAYEQAESEFQEPIASDEDARNRIWREIALREGGKKFKADLLKAYGGRCAFTDSKVLEALEGAHIKPRRGVDSDRTDNGILLRADVHTLFDRGLLWIEESMVIGVSQLLIDSEYGELKGKSTRLPEKIQDRPHPDHIAYHRQFALELEERREARSREAL